MAELDAATKEAEKLKETIRANLKASADTTLAQFANDVPALNAVNLKIRRTLKGHLSKIYAMQWAGESPTLASASQDGRLIVWNAVTCLKMYAIALPTNWVMCCGYSPSGEFVASGGLDNICSVWNLKTNNNNKPLRELNSHTGFLSCCRFLDNKQIITSSGDHTCILWDLDTGTPLTTFRAHEGDVMNISLSPDNGMFVSGSCDHTAITWDIKSGKRAFRYEVCDANDVNAVSFFPSGVAFATGSEDGHLRLFDIRAKNILNDYSTNNNQPAPTSLAFSASGRFLFASYASDPDCLVWDTLRAERKGQVQGHTKRITSIGVSGDGAALCTASWDGFLKIWT